MKASTSTRPDWVYRQLLWLHANMAHIAYGICMLCMFLFVYTAVSKVIALDEFAIQLGKSPITNPHVRLLLWAVPTIEILVGLALVIPVIPVQRVALCCFITLMACFTWYIFMLSMVSEDSPCGCIGISEKIGLRSHVILNIVFALLAAVALLLTGMALSFTVNFLAIGALFGLFVYHAGYTNRLGAHPERHDFVRHYHDPVTGFRHTMDIGVNSYYYAGTGTDGSIYLGNGTSPLHLLRVDPLLRDTLHIRLQVADSLARRLYAPKISVGGGQFYLMDGVTPIILKGEIGRWQAERYLFDSLYFNAGIPTGTGSAAVRILSTQTDSYMLAREDAQGFSLAPSLLEKQVDGKFCSDGMLRYDAVTGRVIYTYYYRNTFIVADSNLLLLYCGRTLDTTYTARLTVAPLKKDNAEVLAAPATVVNKNSTVAYGRLLIQSSIMGADEDETEFMDGFTVDVYDLADGAYLHSFRIPGYHRLKLREFWIDEKRHILYALHGNELVAYQLDSASAYDNDILLAGRMPVEKPEDLLTHFFN